jgi:hypothetical protein
MVKHTLEFDAILFDMGQSELKQRLERGGRDGWRSSARPGVDAAAFRPLAQDVTTVKARQHGPRLRRARSSPDRPALCALKGASDQAGLPATAHPEPGLTPTNPLALASATDGTLLNSYVTRPARWAGSVLPECRARP